MGDGPPLSTSCHCDSVFSEWWTSLDFNTVTMLYLSFLVAVLGFAEARPGFIYSQPITGIQYAEPLSPGVLPHPAVQLNAASEAQLPPELLKSNAFYNNPVIAAGLAKESWFTKKEMQVVEREAEKIPRQKIYDLVSHAGFLDRH